MRKIMSRTYQLMSRQGCHLCQQVAQQLMLMNVDFRIVDIDRDMALREKYHTLVPVLYCAACDEELLYPFSEVDLVAWLARTHGQ
ncbi:glutaredoxin family protein [Cardiobacteriaceae bacterium TAE3-ERU3]|nr:glutaredoxin family protein [Cardiobacteriaceae bacterium TAE3-ERU3]